MCDKMKKQKRALTAILLALCLLLAACAAPAKETTPAWQEQYDLGMRYLTEGNYQEAIIAFTAAIEIDPKQVEAYIARGDAYMGKADGESSAEKDYLYAVELDGSNPQVYGKLADLYLKLGEEDKAKAILEKGYAATGDEALKARLDDLQNDY